MFRINLQRLHLRGMKDFKKNFGFSGEKTKSPNAQNNNSFLDYVLRKLEYLSRPLPFFLLLSGGGGFILFSRSLSSNDEKKPSQNN